jgi:glucarate dehydratase
MATITAVRATPISIPLVAPYHWSCGFVAGFSRTIVEVETSDGVVGLGESPSPADASLLNEVIGPLLLGADPYDHVDCERRCVPSLRELRTITDPSALHAYTGIEVALWDLVGKLEGRSVASLLGGRVRTAAPFTEYFAFRVGREETPVAVASYCAEMIEKHGARAFEGKVGAQDLETDVAMVRELRAAIGDERPIRLDANMAWTTTTARTALRRFEALNVHSVEEPVATYQELARLRPNTTLAFSTHHANLPEAAALGVPDAFVIQLGMFGGIRRTVHFVMACAEFGFDVWFKSPDAGVATAAQLQIAAGVEEVSEPSQTLLRWHADDVIADGPFTAKNGVVAVPDAPGLGVTLDRIALARCHQRFLAEGSYDFRPRVPLAPVLSVATALDD